MLKDEIKKNLKKCARCALCIQNCPIFNVLKDENNSCRGLICKLNGYEEGYLNQNEIKKDLKICLNCSRCKTNCPSKIDTVKVFAYKNANFSPSKISQRLLLLAKLLPIKIFYFLNFFKKNIKPQKTDTIYFKGCVSKAQHKTTFLDNYTSKNLCCGIPYLTSGDIKNYEKVKKHNLKIIKEAKCVIFDCASCKSAVEDYPELNQQDKEKLIYFFDKSLKLKNNSKYKTITFHKPCHMSKSDFEQVEILLNSIEGIKYIPLENKDLCCGFGGSYFIFHPIIALKINLKSAFEIKKTKADLILTICPSCTIGLRVGQIISFNFKKTLELRDFINDL
ncbi:(Fe-S)-binding protein, partial [bacterium]|nr:(Fe-S)-binding protein [bacterium]